MPKVVKIRLEDNLKYSVFSSFPTSPLGYFIHDTVDIVVSRQTRASWEYLVHHVMVRENG